jgi:hypothetical protein
MTDALKDHAPQSPRLDVDPRDGTIYLSWVDWFDGGLGSLNVMTSTSIEEGASWSDLRRYPLLERGLIRGGVDGNLCSGSTTAQTCVGVTSMLSTWFNVSDNSLALVYHQRRGTGTSGAEVVMQTFSTDNRYSSTNGFSGPQRVSDFTTHDQWHGVVACALDASCVVSYYDHDSSDEGLKYRVYARRVKADGRHFAESDVAIYNTLSDTNALTFADNQNHARMEYHDTFYRAGRWYVASVVANTAPSAQDHTSDVEVTSQADCAYKPPPPRRRPSLPPASGGKGTTYIVLTSSNQVTQLSVPAQVSNATYEWRSGDQYDASLCNVVGTGGTLTVTGPGAYWVRTIDSSGEATDSAVTRLVWNPAVSVEVDPSTVIGPLSTLILTAHYPSPPSGTVYEWRQARETADATFIEDLSSPVLNDTASPPSNPRLIRSGLLGHPAFWVRVVSDAVSGAVELGRSDPVVIFVGCETPPRVNIVLSPNDTHIPTGSAINLFAVGFGTDLHYQWYKGPVGDVTWPLASSPSESGIFLTGGPYWVRATDGCGQTADASILLYSCKPTITGNPQGGVVGPGHPRQLTVTAMPAHPEQALTYQWYVGNPPSPIAENAASPTYTATQGGTYFATVSALCDDGVQARVASAPAEVTACGPPTITPLADRDVDRAILHTLQVNATGTDLTYQWYIGAAGVTSNPVPDGTAASITVQPSDNTDYWVRVTDQGVCSADSNTAHLTVCTPPTITANPGGSDVFSGSGVTLTVAARANSQAPLHYTWIEVNAAGNGTPVPGNDSSSFATPPLTASKTWFARVVSGSLIGVYTDSARATVHVCDLPEVHWAVSPHPLRVGDQFTLLITEPPAGTDLDWYRGASGDVASSTLIHSDPNHTYYYYQLTPATATASYWVRVKQGNVCFADSSAITLPVCVPTITQQPAGAAITAGASASLSVAANTAGLTYQWYIGETADVTNPVTTNGTGATYTASPAADTRYWVRVTGSCALSADSDSALVTVCQLPHINQNPTDAAITRGASASLSVGATGSNLTYQWYAGAGTSNPLQTTSSISVAPNTTTTYWVRVSGACGDPQDSTVATVHVCTTPAITAQPQSVTIFGGVRTPLSVTATENGVEPMQYQWYRGAAADTSAPLSGETAASFLTPPLTQATSYWVRVSCGVCNPVDSAAATVSICNYPQVLSAPADQSIAVGQTATLNTFVATGNAYQWYVGASGNTSQMAMDGPSNLSSYTALPGVTTQYWARITNGGCVSRTQSATVFVCVPAITQQPANIMITSGTTTTLTVAATSAVTYQWYRGAAGDTSAPVGTNSASFTTPALTAATSYWVRVTGGCGSPADSATATVTMCAPPAVTSVTPTQSIVRGANTTCVVNATGSNLGYQWYVGASGNTAVPVNGATSSTIAVTPQNTTSYWARLTGQCGTVDSPTTTVRVCTTPAITGQPQSVTIFGGATTTLNVTATENGVEPMQYQWYRGAAGDTSAAVSSATGASFLTPALTQTTTYWVRVTCGVCNPVDSVAATVTICYYPQILSAPADQYIAIGQTATLTTFVASGNAYQWYLGASGNTSQLAQAQSNLSSYSATPGATTQYWAQITNGGCVSRTQSATVFVCVPTITQQPAGIMINSGASTTLTVAANTPGLSYQWYRGATGDTSAPVGTNSASFPTPALTTATSYWVRVTGNCSRSADSATATVTICAPPAITSASPAQSIVRGYSATCLVNTTGSNLSYQWYSGTSGNTAVPVSGATSSTLTTAPQNPTNYWVRVSGSCGTVDSITMLVNVCVTPSITAQPQGSVIFGGGSATLSVTASEATTQSVSYQWYRGAGGDLSAPVGTSAASYTTPALTTPTSYWVRVSCGVCTPANSAAATVSICYYPQILSAPADQFIAVGETATLSTFVTSGNAYQWYIGASGNTAQLAPGASNLSSYSATPSVTTQYWAQITNGGCVSRTQPANVYVCVPTITQQPASVTIPPGSSTTLNASANTAGVAYQWYNGASGNTAAPINGATGASVTVTPGADSSYWVRATSSCGRTTDSATATVTLCAPPAITSQPYDSAQWGPGTAYSSVLASGSNLAYQWYYGSSGDTSQPISGATDSPLALYIGTTTKVWVRITGQCGAVNSNAAFLNIYPTITQPPPQNITVGNNATATISFTTRGSYMNYVWKYGNGTLIATTSTPTLVTPSITANTNLYCEVWSGSVMVTTNMLYLTVCYNAPYIYSISKGGGTSCNNVFANTTAADTYEWYQGARGDTSHFFGSGGPVIYVCPATPTQYWFRAITWSSYNVVSCYSDSPAITMP